MASVNPRNPDLSVAGGGGGGILVYILRQLIQWVQFQLGSLVIEKDNRWFLFIGILGKPNGLIEFHRLRNALDPKSY